MATPDEQLKERGQKAREEYLRKARALEQAFQHQGIREVWADIEQMCVREIVKLRPTSGSQMSEEERLARQNTACLKLAVVVEFQGEAKKMLLALAEERAKQDQEG